ncbi:hypothetical protein CFR73_09490 [Novacetimonas maltaceti]|nr:hypothetical protein CFR73_09490 [Novacetimonas maltaceti]
MKRLLFIIMMDVSFSPWTTVSLSIAEVKDPPRPDRQAVADGRILAHRGRMPCMGAGSAMAPVHSACWWFPYPLWAEPCGDLHSCREYAGAPVPAMACRDRGAFVDGGMLEDMISHDLHLFISQRLQEILVFPAG